MGTQQQQIPTTRLLAKIVRDLIGREHFASVVDLTEALKQRCARLRIAWTNHDIREAYRVIESNRSLVQPPPPEIVVPRVDRPVVFTRKDARARWKYLWDEHRQRTCGRGDEHSTT